MEIWHDYIEQFDNLTPDAIRPGCEPRIHQTGNVRNGLILIHGLTDSPHYMRAVGERFAARGYNVYLPLLRCHGLKKPNRMRGVSLRAWKANVDYAVTRAKHQCRQVSIGGLSTGGALSVWKALTGGDTINGALFLFSAALDIAGRHGDFKEWLGRTLLGEVGDMVSDRFQGSLIGENPYRYSRMDLGGAAQLAHLIEELDRLIQSKEPIESIRPATFIAHSACDSVADIEGVMKLYQLCRPERRHLFQIPESQGVRHAEVVLEEDVAATGQHGEKESAPLERRNPLFPRMMAEALRFAAQHLEK